MAKATNAAAKATKVSNKGFVNPYREKGGYWASCEALKALGIGKMHSFDVIVPAVAKAMADAFKAFKSKEARNEETGKDFRARIIQNVAVVGRKDYGKPLREVGYEVRFDGRAKEAGLFKVK